MPGAEERGAHEEVSALLAAAVREAGELALKSFRSSFRSWIKGSNSPVSEVDIAVDELLRERLMAAAPDYGWLSEETLDDQQRLSASRVWIVDPIDGTRAFIAGREDWVISAALAENGRPVAGAIFAPVENAMFLAVAGHGATLNGRPLQAGLDERLSGARIAGPKRYFDALAAAERVEALPRVHSLALRLARVASEAIDVAFAGGNSRDWDIAAADLIVHEAGGALTDLEGRQATYNRPDPVHGILIAANRPRHRSVLRLLRSA